MTLLLNCNKFGSYNQQHSMRILSTEDTGSISGLVLLAKPRIYVTTG